MALSTWLGVTLPDEQAAPAETMTPSRSSAITWRSESKPGVANDSTLGSRFAAAPKTVMLASRISRACAASRQAAWAVK
jgi:hypothetical protein